MTGKQSVNIIDDRLRIDPQLRDPRIEKNLLTRALIRRLHGFVTPVKDQGDCGR